MNTFRAGISTVKLSPDGDGKRFRVLEPVRFTWGMTEITVPAGTYTDGASVPSTRFFVYLCLGLAWAAGVYLGPLAAKIVASAFLILFALGGELGRWGKYGWAAVLHDYLYSTNGPGWCTRAEADRLFYDFMRLRGTPAMQALFIFWSVRAMGWLFFRRDKTKKEGLK